VTYEERHKWLKMADLLATLMNLLIVQQKIRDQLDREFRVCSCIRKFTSPICT
jgi:hypothetical protein